MKRKTMIRGHKRTEAVRQHNAEKKTQKAGKEWAKDIKLALEHNANDLFGLMRKVADDKVVAEKKALLESGLASDYVVVVMPDVNASAAQGQGAMVTRVVRSTRENVRSSIGGSASEATAMRTSLLRPPRKGAVWVFLRIMSGVILLEEVADTSVADVEAQSET